MKTLKQTQVNQKRGAALVEYALIVAGVALVAAGAVSVFGHKTSALIASSARIIPGTNTTYDNKVIDVGEMVATHVGTDGNVTVDANNLNKTLQQNLGLDPVALMNDPNNSHH